MVNATSADAAKVRARTFDNETSLGAGNAPHPDDVAKRARRCSSGVDLGQGAAGSAPAGGANMTAPFAVRVALVLD
jgi:hypothetical protein